MSRAVGDAPALGVVAGNPEPLGGTRVEGVGCATGPGQRPVRRLLSGIPRTRLQRKPPSVEPWMPEQAVAKMRCGSRRSRVSVKTAESSIIPSCSGVQVLPPSEVFHGRCQVPTEITRGDRHRFHVAELAPRQPTRFRLQDPSSQTSRAGEERFYRASTARGREPCPWRCAGKPPGARASAGPSTYRSESALELVCVARWKESSLTVSVRSICVKVRVIES